MSKRLRDTNTGAVVSVADGKVLGSEWVPVTDPAKSQPAKKQGSKGSTSK